MWQQKNIMIGFRQNDKEIEANNAHIFTANAKIIGPE